MRGDDPAPDVLSENACLPWWLVVLGGLVGRLEAGALAVFPRPADLGEIVADSLDALGPRARIVLADIPPGLHEVMADPAITERIIANLVGNALRYRPASGSGLWCPAAWRRRWAAPQNHRRLRAAA